MAEYKQDNTRQADLPCCFSSCFTFRKGQENQRGLRPFAENQPKFSLVSQEHLEILPLQMPGEGVTNPPARGRSALEGHYLTLLGFRTVINTAKNLLCCPSSSLSQPAPFLISRGSFLQGDK